MLAEESQNTRALRSFEAHLLVCSLGDVEILDLSLIESRQVIIHPEYSELIARRELSFDR